MRITIAPKDLYVAGISVTRGDELLFSTQSSDLVDIYLVDDAELGDLKANREFKAYMEWRQVLYVAPRIIRAMRNETWRLVFANGSDQIVHVDWDLS